MNRMILKNAGIREQEWAQQLIEEKKLPPEVDFQTMLDHAVYDARKDTIAITVKAVTYESKVDRP